MVAADQRLVGHCAVEEGHARLYCQSLVHVEPERPFRMQEADRRVDHDVVGEEHFFAARLMDEPLSFSLCSLKKLRPESRLFAAEGNYSPNPRRAGPRKDACRARAAWRPQYMPLSSSSPWGTTSRG